MTQIIINKHNRILSNLGAGTIISARLIGVYKYKESFLYFYETVISYENMEFTVYLECELYAGSIIFTDILSRNSQKSLKAISSARFRGFYEDSQKYGEIMLKKRIRIIHAEGWCVVYEN